ncbi:hypothetical protein BDN70DRAFT_893149 [Pholiota conissans]|uniref:Uncharacterized protein n=1 Tax=Pholiota conissans TaxID=109636 RepID=A0A9P6D328_9AGAR|nr:hypothetical protein BDN70DRAFT_893149 [Pholiota conissans]
MQALKDVNIALPLGHAYASDLFYDLIAELEQMRSKNDIRSIVLGLNISGEIGYQQCNDLDQLDMVLTESGWPNLEQVFITIYTHNVRAIGGVLPVNEMLRKLPATQFPRLSSNDSLVFRFVTVQMPFATIQ